MKKIFGLIAIILSFVMIPTVYAGIIEYEGKTWNLVEAEEFNVSVLPGITYTKEDGLVNYVTSIPADVSTWNAQIAGEGSTESYIYAGLTITAPEGATKYDMICDALEGDSAYLGDPEYITSISDQAPQCWVPMANYDSEGTPDDLTDDHYVLFSGDREYVSIVLWLDDDNSVVGRSYFKMTRNLLDANSETLVRTEIPASRISLPETEDKATLNDKTITINKGYTGTGISLKIEAPDNGIVYTHFDGPTSSAPTALSNGVATIVLPLGFESREILIEWYTDIDSAVTFEKLNLSFVGEEDEIISEDETVIFESSEGLLPGYNLIVENLTEDLTEEQLEDLNNQLNKNDSLVELLDISVQNNANDVITLDDGRFKIKIAFTENMSADKTYKIVYLDDDYNVEETFTTTMEEIDGVKYLVFITSHLSTYGIVNTVSITNPSTGDKIVLLILVGCISSIGLLGVGLYTKKTIFNLQ